mgnify:FL=1
MSVKELRDTQALAKQAWGYIEEFLDSGAITLPQGGGKDGTEPRTVSPDKEDPTCKVMIDVCKFLGQLQGKPRKTPKAMDDWHPRETKA